VNDALKRLFDLTAAGLGVIFLLPVFAVIAIAIKATSDGPVFFRQTRVGRDERPFRIFKFRTMRPEIGSGSPTITIGDDPRITRVGAVLRRFKLDELPQLFNVIRGDMSCVGPRPVVKDELPQYGDHLGEYLQGRPGLTGLWQVSGRSSVDYASRVALDSQYVRNWSIWLDVSILFKTVFAVMRFDRAS
jgi:exopolysaccharide production protein ExoY